MKNLVQLVFLLSIVSFNSSCQNSNTKERNIIEKDNCYELKLTRLRNSALYNDIMTAFNDTFQILKTKKEYFGVPDVVSNKIDEAIFFKKDSSECMLIVIKKINTDWVFGAARMIRGINKGSKWIFEVSMEFSFGKGYFELYKENSFENLSKIARYSVLTDGDNKRRGCEIDDYYWFTELKK